jgi:hypothetical protein
VGKYKIGELESRLPWAYKARPYLQNNKSNKGWRPGSGDRVTAEQKSQYSQKKRKKERERTSFS